MELARLQSHIEEIIALSDSEAVVFFRAENEVWKVNLNDDTAVEIKRAYIKKIKHLIVDAEDLELRNISEADSRKNAIYVYDFEEVPNEIQELYDLRRDHGKSEFKLKLDEIKSIATVLGNSQKNLVLYKWYYPVNFVSRNRISFFMGEKNRINTLNQDVLNFSSGFDVLVVEDDIFIFNLDAFEKKLDFTKILVKEAEIVVNKILHLDILEKNNSLSIDFHRYAKKFAKLKSSKILNGEISGDRILSFVKQHERLKHCLDENGRIKTSTKKAMKNLIELIDDQYLYSELTGISYLALAKNNISRKFDPQIYLH